MLRFAKQKQAPKLSNSAVRRAFVRLLFRNTVALTWRLTEVVVGRQALHGAFLTACMKILLLNCRWNTLHWLARYVFFLKLLLYDGLKASYTCLRIEVSGYNHFISQQLC